MLVTRRVLLGLTVVLAAACGEAAGGPDTAKTLVRGSVVLSPASPVCRVGSSCSKPFPGFKLFFSRRGKVVSRATTDMHARYSVRLAPGRYAVTTARRGILTPSRVRIPASPRATVNFSFDAGIR